MPKRKRKKQSGPVFKPCGKCIAGLVRVIRGDGSTAMRQCECFLAFKGVKPAVQSVDRKSMAANG